MFVGWPFLTMLRAKGTSYELLEEFHGKPPTDLDRLALLIVKVHGIMDAKPSWMT